MREAIEQLTPYYEWIGWKLHALMRAREIDLAIRFHQDVMEVCRLPIGVLEQAILYGLEPAASSFGTTKATHPIERWLQANPEPLAGTLKAMAALKERWGDRTMMPKEPDT